MKQQAIERMVGENSIPLETLSLQVEIHPSGVLPPPVFWLSSTFDAHEFS
jgi:hypothetical protein